MEDALEISTPQYYYYLIPSLISWKFDGYVIMYMVCDFVSRILIIFRPLFFLGSLSDILTGACMRDKTVSEEYLAISFIYTCNRIVQGSNTDVFSCLGLKRKSCCSFNQRENGEMFSTLAIYIYISIILLLLFLQN